MAIGSDNKFPKIIITEGSAPSSPSAGDQKLYIDSADHHLKRKNSSGSVTDLEPGVTSANHAFYAYLASGLEPLAIENIQAGAFSYVIGAGATKLALATYNTRLGASGRWEVRDPRFPTPLRGVTVTGLASDAAGVFINPAAPTYTDARTTYFDRLNTIHETAPLYIDLAATGTYYTFLPGPYGSIITNISIFDLTWIVVRPYGTSVGWNLTNEIGDAATDWQRVAQGCYIPISKLVAARLLTGAERSAGTGKGSITYFNCLSTWGKVTDATSYNFRDDFMGASLDTTTNWNRTQSAGGNMEIQTAAGVANWCKILGDGNWGNNTITSKTSVARAAGKVFLVDVYPAAYSGGAYPNIMVGWYDGAGTSYTDLAHAIDFTGTGAGPTYQLQVFEAGVSRGVVGAGYTPGSIYRVRITLGASNAAYAIQGGPEYGAIGSASWTDITPGTTSNSTTPLYAGIVVQTAQANYISDVKLY